jgi:hypothetical protein
MHKYTEPNVYAAAASSGYFNLLYDSRLQPPEFILLGPQLFF